MTVKTVEVSRGQAFMGIVVFAALGLSGWQYVSNGQRQTTDTLKTHLTEQEIRLLQQELANERAKPTYDEGFRDALLRRGGPQNPGSYKDGYEAAVKLLSNQGYAEGYHTAIEQFSYQTKGEELVPKPVEEKKSEPKK